VAYTVEDLLSVLHPHCPVKVDALCRNRRRVEHGLTTVGLKIHSLGDNRELLSLIEALGGRSEVIANRVYAHARASVTVILPPVGTARSAILLLECIEKYFGHPVFHNPRYQIQVCSPCRLDGPRAAILAIAFYLGSDVLRRYSLEDLTTTFSEDTLPYGHKHRGRRIVLYDGEGDLDRDFEWWDREKDRFSILPQLPFLKERTDVLTCQSKTDIENINLIATLLSNHQTLAYWEHLGRRFVTDVEGLLERHLLRGSLRSPGSTRRRGNWLTTRSSSPPFKSSWRMRSKSMHGLKKSGVTNGGGEVLPIALAYWQKCKRCCSTTAPNSSWSPADYCRRERHESASARFDTNRHPRNGSKSRLYSRARARAGAGADQSAGKGARKSNRPGVIRGVFLSAVNTAEPRPFFLQVGALPGWV
jgi:hypothetical protein